MFSFLKLALRNLMRRKRRSVLTGIMIGVGTLVMLLVFTFSISVDRSMTESVIKTCTGDIQIHDSSMGNIDIYSAPATETPFLKDSDKIIGLIKSEVGIYKVASRIRIQGMLVAGEESTGITVNAVEPKVESEITPKIKIIEGSYITEKNGVLVGKNLAIDLNTKVGDKYTFYTASADGEVSQISLKVQGIYAAEGMGMFLDRSLYIDINNARESMHLNNFEASEVVISLKNGANEKEVMKQVKSTLSKAGFKLRYDSWKDIAGMFYGIILACTIMPQMSLVIIFIVVAVGIINTILMSILERTKEIGTMMALGTKGRQILVMFILESGILGVFAAGIALIIGGGIIIWLSKVGIPAPISVMQFAFGGEKLYFILKWWALLITLGITFLFSITIAFFAAIKVTKLNPVQALYNN